MSTRMKSIMPYRRTWQASSQLGSWATKSEWAEEGHGSLSTQ